MEASQAGQIRKANEFSGIPVGEYLSIHYIESIQKSLSPFKSNVFGTPLLVKVSVSDNGETIIVPVFNFHEGGPEFSINRAGKISTVLDAGFDTKNLAIKRIGTRELSIGFDQFPEQIFVFVGSAEKYVAQQVLEGIYLNTDGKCYMFQSDGVAIFAGNKIRYSIGVDHVVNKFDYFVNNTNGTIYGFRKKSTILEIFETHGEINQIVDTDPILSLRQLQNAKKPPVNSCSVDKFHN